MYIYKIYAGSGDHKYKVNFYYYLLLILRDLVGHVEKENIKKLVILFIDGSSSHLGVSSAATYNLISGSLIS